MSALTDALRAAAHPSRMEILTFLAANPGASVRAVRERLEAAGLPCTQPTASHHVTILINAGLVEQKSTMRRAEDGTLTEHRIVRPAVESVIAALGRLL